PPRRRDPALRARRGRARADARVVALLPERPRPAALPRRLVGRTDVTRGALPLVATVAACAGASPTAPTRVTRPPAHIAAPPPAARLRAPPDDAPVRAPPPGASPAPPRRCPAASTEPLGDPTELAVAPGALVATLDDLRPAAPADERISAWVESGRVARWGF